jgi:DNA-binding SARP family transcriptional activator
MQIDDVQEDNARPEPDPPAPQSGLTFGVLGPLEVRTGHGLIHVGGPQIRALLALLLIRPGQVMSLSTLVASLWSSDAPPSAERTARTYMSRLRLALAPLMGRTDSGPLIVTAPPGYLLRTDRLSVDASVFEELAVTGRQALTRGDPVTARSQLSNALRLWRGDAFAEFPDVPLLRAEASRLEELRLSAVENRLQSELRIGMGPDLVAELNGLVTTHPLRERLWVQYLTALYRSGRQAEALSAYQRARTLLADELGLEPSVELVDTHRRILAQDPKLLPIGAPGVAALVRERAANPAGAGPSSRDRDAEPRPDGRATQPDGSTTKPDGPATKPDAHPVAAPQRALPATPPALLQHLPLALRPAAATLVTALSGPSVRAMARQLGRGLALLGRGVAAGASVILTRLCTRWGWRPGESLADMK